MNDAAFSADHMYRYWLCRYLAPRPVSDNGWTSILWVMLNPSTADCTVNDPTIRQCMAFSVLWGFDCMDVVNLFAFRATDPRDLVAHRGDPIGPDNNTWIDKKVAGSSMIVCAWGAAPFAKQRAQWFERTYNTRTLYCLGRTKSGQPWHPLYRPHHLAPKFWSSHN